MDDRSADGEIVDEIGVVQFHGRCFCRFRIHDLRETEEGRRLDKDDGANNGTAGKNADRMLLPLPGSMPKSSGWFSHASGFMHLYDIWKRFFRRFPGRITTVRMSDDFTGAGAAKKSMMQPLHGKSR